MELHAGGYYYRGSTKKTRNSTYMNRKQIVRIIIFMALFTASFLFGAMINVYASDEDESIGTTVAAPAYIGYSVESGDTLWSIAKRYVPEDRDIRNFIHDIKQMNSLKSSGLQEGQLLLIPTVQ